MSESETQWLVDLYEEQGTSLHRLVVMLGAESESGHILRAALIGLSRRAHRLVDPLERVEFLAEVVVHDARSVRGPSGTLHLPEVAEARQQEILTAIAALPIRLGEVMVISHYLSVFGPELAGILRMTVRSANHRLEESLDQLRRAIGDPTPGSSPGVIESLSQEVTAALRSSARLVQPAGTETLEAELRSLNEGRRKGVALKALIPLLVGALALGFWLAAFTTPGTNMEASPTVSPTVAPMASASRSLPAQVRAVPVYYVGRQNMMLYRELRDLPATNDLVWAAISAILTPLQPLDSDYDSLWGGGRLNDVTMTGHKLTLDLSASAFEDLTTPRRAQAAVDQMVYTASELVGDPELRVLFKSDGRAPPEMLRSEEGFGRRGLDPMPALWLSSPKNGAKLSAGQLVIVGTLKPDASAPLLRIKDQDGTVVSSTTAQTATEANQDGWRVWSVTVSLTPGTYLLEATTQIQGSDGRLRSVSEDKTVTVS
ncbi:GerMN domain-containing protein [Tessaracoccus antarcticus]|uniref:GerMN domain-containing protein n=1 Tax=Tessaracoccus antarcticus TaxID=2479848 RepID=UPI001F3F4683|nr:GerMN domain-containing protein [Tessaracoccus antarcticus]